MSLLTESGEFIKTKAKYFGEVNDDASTEFWRLIMGIVISSICTFAISFSTSWCVRITGPTTYSMVGALNKLPIAILGMIFFDAVVSVASVSSIFIGTLVLISVLGR
jgi:GDP-mannose transporter